MVFKRAIVAELSNAAGAVFTVMFSIIFSIGLVRILGEAAGGRIDSGAVFAILALTALTYLPTVLTLTIFVSVLITVSRAYRDSEMVVWFTSGQSLMAWINPVLRFSAPIVVLVAVLSLLVTPWANRQIVQSKTMFAQRDDVSKIAPGRFIESSGADRVFFIESVDVAGMHVKNVFVSHRSQGREGVIVAAQGMIETRPSGDRYLILENGRRYEGKPGDAEYRMMEFDRYAVRMDSRPETPLADLAVRAKATDELWRKPTLPNLGELLWRTALPIGAIVVVLLAIPLGYSNPRIGRNSNLIVAVLAFLVYNNLISIVQSYVQRGKMPFSIGVWAVHALMLALIALLFARRVYWQGWLPRRWPVAMRLRARAGQ
jgi:lipopolysaccharide export system permease protein